MSFKFNNLDVESVFFRDIGFQAWENVTSIYLNGTLVWTIADYSHLVFTALTDTNTCSVALTDDISRVPDTVIVPSIDSERRTVTEVAELGFNNCTATTVILPDSITTLNAQAFTGSTELTSITLGSNLTTIGSHAFSRCSSLPNIVIPDKVTTIGLRAFDACTSLKWVVIPKSVTSINGAIFSSGYEGNKSVPLETIYYKGTASDWDNINITMENTWGDNYWWADPNYVPKQVTHYYNYSETHPKKGQTAWRYKDGVPVAWCNNNFTAATSAPTCTEEGFTQYWCKTCGYFYRDNYTAALGHTWENTTVGVTTRCITCQSPGVHVSAETTYTVEAPDGKINLVGIAKAGVGTKATLYNFSFKDITVPNEFSFTSSISLMEDLGKYELLLNVTIGGTNKTFTIATGLTTNPLMVSITSLVIEQAQIAT